MPILVTKTYLVDTDDMDEAYDLTKIKSDKVDIFAIGRLVNYDPNAQPVQPAVPGQPTGQPVVPPHLQGRPAPVSPGPATAPQPSPPSGT